MSRAEKLYTPKLLALTLELARYPYDESLPQHGRARSQSCGSTLALAVGSDDTGRVTRVGMRVQACAVGQASAALFARHVVGKCAGELDDTLVSMGSWLGAEGPLPTWPGLDALSPARAFPGRHGAILLPWRAALDALSTRPRNR